MSLVLLATSSRLAPADGPQPEPRRQVLLLRCYFALRYTTSILAPVGSGLTATSRRSSPDRVIPLRNAVPSLLGRSAASNCWVRSFSASLTDQVPALAAKKSSTAAASSSAVGWPGELNFGR